MNLLSLLLSCAPSPGGDSAVPAEGAVPGERNAIDPSGWLAISGGLSGTVSTTAESTIWGGYDDTMDFGDQLTGVGDLDGDGDDEVLVRAAHYGGRGYGWLFEGDPAGASEDEDLLLEGQLSSESWAGIAHADVNQDGYEDLVIRQREDLWDATIKVWEGSASGISETATQSLTVTENMGVLTDAAFCDVNGDSYPDLTVTADGGFEWYAGSSAGLASASTKVGKGPFNCVIDCAGDVNGDGYQDVLIGDYISGTANLYLGSSAGLGTTPDWTQSTSAGVAKYGYQVVGLGDVDGDGYDDFAVGHKAYGYVELFLGSSTGPATTPDQTYLGSIAGHAQHIAAPGDVDGDGLDDLALLEPLYGSYGTTALGRITLHLGATGGPSTTADASYLGDPSVGIGAMGAAGDVNGDGVPDLVIGQEALFAGVLELDSGLGMTLATEWEPEDWYGELGLSLATDDWDGDGYDDLAYGLGEAGVGLSWGAASGVSDAHDETLAGTGTLLRAPGDIDGDGYPELVVVDLDTAGGAAEVFYGGSAGFSASTDTVTLAETTPQAWGLVYGDFDGDGYQDLVLGGDHSFRKHGQALLYSGSASGIESTASWTFQGDTKQYVGYALAVGDVDADGYDDLILTTQWTGSTCGQGVQLFLGSASGLASTPDQSTTLSGWFLDRAVVPGDVNGDGYDDVLVGEASGSVLLLGSATGLSSTGTGPTPVSGAEFGEFFAIGDANGDGYDDVALGDGSEGTLLLYLGSASGLDTDWDRAFEVETEDTQIGEIAAGADLNGDGVADLAVALEPEETFRGRVAIFPGEADSDGDGWPDSEDCDPSDASVTMLDWYSDSDGDGYGDPTDRSRACTAPSGTVSDDTDCDDTDSAVHPGTSWYSDADADGYGDSSSVTVQCAQPSGAVLVDGDCDDTDSAINPGAQEVCDAQDTDEDCDGLSDDADSSATGQANWYTDSDGDGYGLGSTLLKLCEAPSGAVRRQGDCDDGDPTVNPGAVEICDALDTDEDCDGLADEADDSVSGLQTWYPDNDGDGFGLESGGVLACEVADHILQAGDCDDGDAAIHPDALELCAGVGVDEDCDGLVDERDAADLSTFYADNDGDGFGDPDDSAQACSAPSDFVSDSSDCDDTRADVHPGAPEVCDADDTDEDCDGLSGNDDAELASGTSSFFVDSDGDGYGDVSALVYLCEAEDGFVADHSDCDDTRADVNPGAVEVCDDDDVDEDCDHLADDADPEGAFAVTPWNEDLDGDGYGSSVTEDRCDGGEGWALNADDCDDSDGDVYPGAPETPRDGVDQDCDGSDSRIGGCSTRGGTGSGTPLAALVLAGLLLRRRRRPLAG